MTSRGWSSTGKAPLWFGNGCWTGNIPFEIKTLKALVMMDLIGISRTGKKKLAGDVTSY